MLQTKPQRQVPKHLASWYLAIVRKVRSQAKSFTVANLRRLQPKFRYLFRCHSSKIIHPDRLKLPLRSQIPSIQNQKLIGPQLKSMANPPLNYIQQRPSKPRSNSWPPQTSVPGKTKIAGKSESPSQKRVLQIQIIDRWTDIVTATNVRVKDSWIRLWIDHLSQVVDAEGQPGD